MCGISLPWLSSNPEGCLPGPGVGVSVPPGAHSRLPRLFTYTPHGVQTPELWEGFWEPKGRGEWGRWSYLRQATLHFGISVPAQRPVLWVSFEATQDKPVHMSS